MHVCSYILSLHGLSLSLLSNSFDNASGFRRYGFDKTFEVIRKRNFKYNASGSTERDRRSDPCRIFRTEKNAGLRIRGWGGRGHSVSTDLLCKRL